MKLLRTTRSSVDGVSPAAFTEALTNQNSSAVMPTSDTVGLRLARKVLNCYRRTNLRGQTLLTLFLARRMKSLQSVAINIADWPPIYMNMQYLNAHFWFLGTPFKSSPYEMNEQKVMRRFVEAGAVVFDVGANQGVHTMLLSRLVGPRGLVVAFEPNMELLPTLELTIAGISNTKLYACALSDQNSESTLFVPDDHTMASLADWTKNRQAGFLSRLFGFGGTHTLSCQQRRMDDLLKEDRIPIPDFIKCDVEGAELMVFKGGSETLNRPDAPIILFEAGVDSASGFDLKLTAAADFLASLREPGYRFLELREDGTLQEISQAEFKPQNQNILAVPKAKSALCHELKT